MQLPPTGNTKREVKTKVAQLIDDPDERTVRGRGGRHLRALSSLTRSLRINGAVISARTFVAPALALVNVARTR